MFKWKKLWNLWNQCRHVRIDLLMHSPRCSFSLPQSESRVLMRRRCPANRTLSASLVSISEVQLGSKLSSQEISSSSMLAGLTFIPSISEADAQIEHQAKKNFIDIVYWYCVKKNAITYWWGHPKADTWGQSTLCTGTKTWQETGTSILQITFQSCSSPVVPTGLPLVDSSHHRCGAPQWQLSSENDWDKEQIGFLHIWESWGVRLAQRVQLITGYPADLVKDGHRMKR